MNGTDHERGGDDSVLARPTTRAASRTDQYILYRRVNNLPQKHRGEGNHRSSGHELLPVHEAEQRWAVWTRSGRRSCRSFTRRPIHGSPADTASSAITDSIRVVRMTVTGLYNDPDKGAIMKTVAELDQAAQRRNVALDSMRRRADRGHDCHRDDRFPPSVQPTKVTIAWVKSLDQDAGERDVGTLHGVQEVDGELPIGEARSRISPLRRPNYSLDDTTLPSGNWVYGVVAQDCSPANSAVTSTGVINVSVTCPACSRTPAMWAGRVQRRGTALILVLLMTVTLAAIAMSAILLTGSGGMIGRYYDRERDFRYAAEASLQMGKARLLRDTTIHLPDTGYVTLVSGGTDHGCRRSRDSERQGRICTRVTRTSRRASTASTRVSWPRRTMRVERATCDAWRCRRRTLRAMQCSRTHSRVDCATAPVSSSPAARTATRDGIRATTPTYYDTVSAVLSVTGGSPTYKKGYDQWCAVHSDSARVASSPSLHTHAVEGNLDVRCARERTSSSVRTRLEFVAVDLNNDSKITADE